MSRLFARSALLSVAWCHRARQPGSARSFSLPGLRPSTSNPLPVFRSRPTAARLCSPFTPTPETSSGSSEGRPAVVDAVPRASITSHPALSGAGSQIRCGPRRYMNMNRPSRLVRQRRHGFLNRIRTRTGRQLLERRKAKKRTKLSA